MKPPRTARFRLLVVAAAVLLIPAGSCSDEASPGDAADSGADTAADRSAELDGEDVLADAGADPDAEDAEDAADDDAADEDAADQAEAVGTIAGNIFNNTGITEGVLRVGLFDAVPPSGEPLAQLVFESPTAPAQAYEFIDAPVGPLLYVVAILDLDEGNPLTDPGPGDLYGQIEDPVGLAGPGDRIDNINVEVR